MNMILEITLRLFVALLLGGVIGIEREYRSKEAGFRTHFLVALGSDNILDKHIRLICLNPYFIYYCKFVFLLYLSTSQQSFQTICHSH